MSPNPDLGEMPAELSRLGEFRRLFEASGRGVRAAVWRGLFPMAVAVILVMVGETWLVPRDWKYYLLCAVAVAMFLNGLRVVIQAWRRRRQKIAVFEHGFALWRNDVLSVFRWDQVEGIDALPEFFGFTVRCRTDEGRPVKIKFDTSADPTQNLRDLWRELEELSAEHRIPAVRKAIAADEEAVFVRKLWGKEVGTKIGVSRMGIRTTPRYGTTTFIDWREVGAVKVGGDRLLITDEDDETLWLNEPVLDVPGYAALVAAAEYARREYLALHEQLSRDRIPAALAAIDAGQELTLGNIGVSRRGLRVGSDLTQWDAIFEVERDYDHLAVDAGPVEIRLDYGKLSFADRLALWPAVERAQELAEMDGDEEPDEDVGTKGEAEE